jgi:hypothetical protein
MTHKHIFYVHGRNIKPTPAALKRMLRLAITSGLSRVDRQAAALFEESEVEFTVAYFGDLMNELMLQARPDIRTSMVLLRDKWYEPHHRDWAPLDELIARPTRRHAQRDYKQLIRKHKNQRFLDDLAHVFGPVSSVTGLTTYAVKRMFPDFGAYLTSRAWASQIRARLQRRLKRALARGDEIALVSHSMGSVVSYDVLWKLSRLSEHQAVHNRKVSLWLTLGCPLGEKSIRDELYDSNEPDDGVYPSNIVNWVNVAAHDDFVARDATVADDFKKMLERGLVQRVKDMSRIYTFWVGSKGSNPHKSYGYLNHPTVARVLARWIRRT